MYNAFRISEKVFIALAVIGFLLKSALTDGGSPILLIGSGLLATLYFLGGYFQARPVSFSPPEVQHPVHKAVVLRILSGLPLAVVVVGILFRLMIWPGDTDELTSGLVLGIPLLIWAFLSSRNLRQGVPTQVFYRLAAVMIVGAATLFTPVSSLIRWFHRDDTELADKMIYQVQHPNDPAAAQAVRSHLQTKRQQP
ncbi:hypothetical protein [Hymenobacter sp. 102]|uniref:hypothetical protein n=1 Tax=Hymenobacter sp. 102 TaxID=3403152 RepID=UPI003CFB0553